METSILTAHIAWGLCADPGDTIAAGLIEREGIVGALARVRSRESLSSLVKFLGAELGPERTLRHHLNSYRLVDDPARVEVSLKRQRLAGIELITAEHPHWPPGLADLGPFAPRGLWISGQQPSVTSQYSRLAIVGSRRATSNGVANTQALVAGAWCDQSVIVSGGALGIDTAAHRNALDNQRGCVAVLAGGLDHPYPAENTGLMAQISASGVVLSESPCTTRPRAELFLHRNRLIAALSHGVVVVEAAFRSGAMNTASHAAALGREVGVVPGRWSDATSAGCFRIARERGAVILSEPADVAMLLPTPAGGSS